MLKMNFNLQMVYTASVEKTSVGIPNKVLVYIHNNKIVRVKGVKLARLDPAHKATNSSIYFYRDNFDVTSFGTDNRVRQLMEYNKYMHVLRLSLF